MEKPRAYVGGQAVIEGVMMRGPQKVATAVRLPDGKITVQCEPVHSLTERFPFLKKTFIRGSVALCESLLYGMRSLAFSAKAAEEEETVSDVHMGLTLTVSVVMAIVFFILLPTYGAHFLLSATAASVHLNLAEGGLRLLIFLLYIWGISFTDGMYRVFQYHGAEHKTIWTYEAGEPLTVENVKKHSRLHPRCGTNFLLIVMVVSIFVFAFLGWPGIVFRVLSRIIFMPVVAGISYEIIRLAADSSHPCIRTAVRPGLWLQYLTTREPQADQIEVAIAALEAAKPSTGQTAQNL